MEAEDPSFQEAELAQQEPQQPPQSKGTGAPQNAPTADPSAGSTSTKPNAATGKPGAVVPPVNNKDNSLLLSIGKEFPFLQPYKYDAENRRDPFRSFTFGSAEAGPGEPVGPILPLQRYDLDDLKLIGIMWDVRSPKAMFLDPNKEVHTLGKDDRIGRNNGYIAVIREGEVVVVEAEKIRDELVYTSRVLKMDR